MNLIRLAIQRPTAVCMFALVVLATGFASFTQLPLDLAPDVSFPKLSVITLWPDSSPETIEAFVTSPIESAAGTVNHVKKVDSISEEGKSTVNVEFDRGVDMDFAALELSEKLSILRDNFPVGVLPPQVQKYVPEEFQTGRFLSYHLTGDMNLHEIRKLALERLRSPLLAVEGVAGVQVYGGQAPELQIEIDPVKLQAFNLHEDQVRAVLTDLNIHQVAGRLHEGRTKIDLIISDPLTSPKQILDIVLAEINGTLIRVNDVANVKMGFGEVRHLTRINGNPAIVFNIEKEVGTNTVTVADRVFRRLSELSRQLPKTLKLIKERDQSEQIRKHLANLVFRAAFCVLVIFVVLRLFFRNWRSPVIILATIFFSVLLAINLFYVMNIGLNLLTLAGLALAFGMMVDNSIVVLDNITRCRRQGISPAAAAEQGTREVALPITASTLTTVVAFIPFLYLTGELRIYYLPFTLAVGLALLASLLVAFTFTPSLVVQIESCKTGISHQNKVDNKEGLFALMLLFVLRHRLFTLFLTLTVFATSFYFFDKHVTKGRIWAWGEDTYLAVFIHMPVGSEISRTNDIIRKFENVVAGNSKIGKVFANITPEYARMEVTFTDEVKHTTFPLILKEQLTVAATQIAGPAVGVYGYGQGYYSGSGTAPQYLLQVRGYNYNKVKQIAQGVAQKLKRNPRIRDVDIDSFIGFGGQDDLFEMVLKINRKKLKRFHLTSSGVLGALQSRLRESLDWQRITLGGREIDYRVKMLGYREFNLEDLQNLLIETPAGEKIRINQLANIGKRKVMAKIVREEQQYVRGISFEYRGPWKYGNRLVENLITKTKLPHGYKLERKKFFFLTGEQKSQIYCVLAFALLLVFMVTAGLFESLLQPIVVLLTVPLALVGVFFIFYFTNTNFDRSAYIGVILLAGIVVNNSIILVHHINDLRRKGSELLDAVIQGTLDRVRPIMMTSATTILGLLPLVLFTKPEQSIWYALSLATIGGLLSSTLLVLVVIPVLLVGVKKVTVQAY